MKTLLRAACAVAMVLAICTTTTQAEITLKDTDRVIILGDTSFGHVYTADWIDQFLNIKYPDLKAEIICFGIPDSTAVDGVRRLNVEVLPLKPTQVILCFGLDEEQRKPFNQKKLDEFVSAMGTMIDSATAAGAKVVLLTPPLPDEIKNKGLARIKYNDIVAKYADAVRKIGQEKNIDVIDWHAAMSGILEKSKKANTLEWTKHGIKPTGISVAAMTSALLDYWKAEPINYVITADWQKPETVSVNSGSVSASKTDDKKMTIKLTQATIPLNNEPKGSISAEDWPLTKWCNYKLKIENMPEGGVIISDGGKSAKPFLSQQLAEGADMSVVGPLANNDANRTLRNAIRTKLNQFAKYRESCHQKAPEPELEEGYNLWLAAYKSLAYGAMKIAARTPTTFDMTLTVELAGKTPVNTNQGPKKFPVRPKKK